MSSDSITVVLRILFEDYFHVFDLSPLFLMRGHGGIFVTTWSLVGKYTKTEGEEVFKGSATNKDIYCRNMLCVLIFVLV